MTKKVAKKGTIVKLFFCPPPSTKMQTEAIAYFYEEMSGVESAMEPLRTLASPVRRTLCSALCSRTEDCEAFRHTYSQVFL